MSDIRKIVKSTGIYFVGNILSKLMVFFLVPLYTKYINSAAFGYYDAATAIVQFTQNLIFMDIGAVILRYMFDIKDNKNKAICVGMFIFSMCLIVYGVGGTITALTAPVEYPWYLLAYGLVSMLTQVSGFICRGYGNNVYYAASGVVSTLINVSLNLILILVAKMDYSSLYIAIICSCFVQFAMLEIKNKSYKSLKKEYFDKSLLKEMFRYALPLAVNSVAYWGLSSLNKVIVTFMLGAAANGYLAIANKFTSAVYLLSTCFQLAWQELAYSKDNSLSKETGEYYTKALDLLIRVVMVGLALMLPAIKILLAIFPSFIDASYSTSIYLIPLAMGGAIVSIVSSFVGSIFGGIKKSNMVFVSTLIGAIVNVGLVVGLIYAGVGVQAANIGFMVGFFVNLVARFISLKKYINLKVKYWYFLAFVPIYAGISFMFLYLKWYYLIIAIAVVVSLGVLLFKNEIKDIAHKIKAKKTKKVLDESVGGDVEKGDEKTDDKAEEEKMYIEKLHKHILKMLDVFHAFCVENGLTYYICGGTQLGATRHKGFIPWDDDADVMMPINDYNKLIDLRDKLPEGIEIKDITFDKEHKYPFIKMYDVNTTYIEGFGKSGSGIGGVYLDIFPMIPLSNNYKKAIKMMRKFTFMRKIIYLKNTGGKRDNFIKNIYTTLIRKIPLKYLMKKVVKMLNKKTEMTQYVTNPFGIYGDKDVVELSWVGQPKLYEFDGLQLYGVQDDDAYLSRIYGDYMTLPPEEKRHIHTIAFCDFNLPYREYLKMQKDNNVSVEGETSQASDVGTAKEIDKN